MKRKLTESGFTLLETMIAVSLATIVSLGISEMIVKMNEMRARMDFASNLQSLRGRINNAVLVDGSFLTNTVPDPANTPTMGCLQIPQIGACNIAPSSPIPIAPAPIAVLYEGNVPLIDNRDQNGTANDEGFTVGGQFCEGFPSAACPFRYNILWAPTTCAGLSPTCANPPVQVMATLAISPVIPNNPNFPRLNPANYAVTALRFGAGVSVITLCQNLGGTWNGPGNRCNLYNTPCPNPGDVLTGFNPITGAMLCQSERCAAGQFASYLPNNAAAPTGSLTCVPNSAANAVVCNSTPTQNVQALIGIRHDGTAICRNVLNLCPGQTVLGIDQNENPICGSPTSACGVGWHIRSIASDGSPVCIKNPDRQCALGEYVREIYNDGTVNCAPVAKACPSGTYLESFNAGGAVCQPLPVLQVRSTATQDRYWNWPAAICLNGLPGTVWSNTISCNADERVLNCSCESTDGRLLACKSTGHNYGDGCSAVVKNNPAVVVGCLVLSVRATCFKP